jgi:Zn-dependent peptidase ImmA (M78 family)
MNEYNNIIKNKIKELRQQYNLGNYCGRSIFDFIEKFETDGGNIVLFRLPFKNNNLAGFVGYKNNRFSIYTNTNKTLGYEIFTAAHEVFHIIENSTVIKENVILEENISDDEYEKGEISDILADMFAAELLMPEEDVIKEYNRLLDKNMLKKPNESIVIMLQQQYYVEYKAMTKRLKEIKDIEFDNYMEDELNKILCNENKLMSLTKKLGYSNDINKPSINKVYLPKLFLKMTEENYKNLSTNFDDLTVLFSYCNLSPQDFGYEEDELTDEAKALEAKLKAELGE